MAMVSFLACDECGQAVRKSVDLDGRVYCSRDCYLKYCKRVFDMRWMKMLATRELPPARALQIHTLKKSA